MSLNNRLKTILTRGVDRNLLAFDSLAPPGVFTARLIRLMKSEYEQIFHTSMRFLTISEKTMGYFIHEDFNGTITIDGVYISLMQDTYNLDVQNFLTDELKAFVAVASGNHLEEDKEFAIGFNVYPFNELNNNCECLLGSF